MSERPFIDLVALLEAITDTAEPHVQEAGGEQWLLDPSTKKYQRVSDLVLPEPVTRNVSNALAFELAVLEEARRRKNPTGDHMTVIFNASGGLFCADDRNRRNPDTWTYDRSESNPLIWLRGAINKAAGMDHADLLRVVSSLRFHVVDFAKVYSSLRRVRFGKKVDFNSAPKIIDGQAGSQFSVAFTLDGGGAGEAQFPTEFTVSMPLWAGEDRTYDVVVEIEPFVAEKSLRFVLRADALGAVQAQAIKDEIDTFTAAVKAKLPDILIVTDL